MSDESEQELSLTEQPGKRGVRLKSQRKTLSPERVQSATDAIIYSRLEALSRYAQVAIFRKEDADRPEDAIVGKTDTPIFQVLFKMRELYQQCEAIEDTNDRIRACLEVTKQTTAICIHIEKNNPEAYAELMRLREMEDSKSSGGIDMASLIKDAGM